MSIMERLKPDPIPDIHPMPEYRVTGQRAQWYEDAKQVLQVPWMGVVTMAHTHYPTFFGELWRGLRPLCRSHPFIEACMDLRAYAESQAAELNRQSLWGHRCADRPTLQRRSMASAGDALSDCGDGL